MPKGVYERTEKHRAILSKAHIGRPSPHRTSPRTQATKDKIAASMKIQRNLPEWKKKVSSVHKGRKRPVETGIKIGKALKIVYSDPTRCSNWKGGISFEPYCPKFNNDLRNRIRAFFDNRCVACGNTSEEARTKKNIKLSCHHVEYNKEACCDGLPVRFVALCHKCHGKTNQDRHRWESMFHRIIDEIYDGKSYFTKDEFQSKLSATDVTESDMKDRS